MDIGIWILSTIISLVIAKVFSENWENIKSVIRDTIRNFKNYNAQRKRNSRKRKMDRKVKKGIPIKNIKNPYTQKDHRIDNPHCCCRECILHMEDWESEAVGIIEIGLE